jgi:glycine C-acetyltransferase
MNYFDKADIITGTFSKTLGNVGGYFVSTPKMISFLHYQSRQNTFSATATPAILGVAQRLLI